MTIKVKQKSEDVIMVRCNNENEIRFILGTFLEIKRNLGNHIIVKDINGNELTSPKLPESPPQPKSSMDISEEMDKQKEVVVNANNSG